MVEFNPDGSLKLTGSLAHKDEEDKRKMKMQRCITIKKEIVNFSAPKKCALNITLSDAITDARFIDTIFKRFKARASVPCSMKITEDCTIQIEIGTDFRRCTDCTALMNQYREFVEVIEDKGNCTFEGRKNFSYADHFD